MAKIQFKISAKAARLIGRENITGVDGAIIELVKNAYDADAECVYLQYNIKYPYLAQSFDYELITSDLSQDELLLFMQLYNVNDGMFEKVTKEEYIGQHILEFESEEKVSEEYSLLENSVQHILFKRNEIVLIDNGCGMTKEIVENSWMRIGTSYKETNYVSDKGRIKTGAKGIGRFALDKLSTESLMYTKSDNSKLVKWNIDWEQFSNSKLLNEIDAELTESNESFFEVVKGLVGEHFDKISQYTFANSSALFWMKLTGKDISLLYRCVDQCTVLCCCCHNLFILCSQIIRMYEIYIRIFRKSFKKSSLYRKL